MLKYAKIVNPETKQVDVGLGDNGAFYQSIGMTEQEVEQSYRGDWYLLGYAPPKPTPTYYEQRALAYPDISEQLDMMYWDKVNGTDNWQQKIASIKSQYPKPTETEDV